MLITNLRDENTLKQNYNVLTSGRFSTIPIPVAIIPTIEQTDYFIPRYFVQPGNGGNVITEVAKANYDVLVSSAFYLYVDLNWAVRGEKKEVSQHNQTQLQTAEQTLSGLSKKIINLLDLYQGLT